MSARHRIERLAVAVVTAWLTCSCSPQPATESSDAAWVGTVTTEGNVTTVVNESGSGWGGAATLVEEASIGVESGEGPYLFGQVRSITATGDRIIVADPQVPVVRVYDFSGVYLYDLGRAGDGPGEYRRPWSVRTDGDRVFIRDEGRYVVHLYELGGGYIETWDTQHRVTTFTQMVLTDSGGLLTWASRQTEDGAGRQSGMQAFDASGPVGPLTPPPTFDFEPVRVLAEDATGSRRRVSFPPQYPNVHWAFDGSGRRVAGVATDYRFEVRSPDGGTLMVEKYWERVPIPEEERADERDKLTNWAREVDPGWRWEIPPFPENKPPFRGFLFARSGEIWVLRPMESYRMGQCAEPGAGFVECWRQDVAYDIFDPGGRFLGTVSAPHGLLAHLDPHVDDDVFIGVLEDEHGTIMVKRYRLVPPGES